MIIMMAMMMFWWIIYKVLFPMETRVFFCFFKKLFFFYISPRVFVFDMTVNNKNMKIILTSSCAFAIGAFTVTLTGGSALDQMACVFGVSAVRLETFSTTLLTSTFDAHHTHIHSLDHTHTHKAYALGFYAGNYRKQQQEEVVQDQQKDFSTSHKSTKSKNNSLHLLLLLSTTIVTGVLSYYNSLPGVWIYDDWEAIVFNQDVTGVARITQETTSLPQRVWNGIFSSVEIYNNDFWGQPLKSHRSHKSWRPFTILTYRLQAAMILDTEKLTFDPEDATWFRFVNIMLHAVCSGILAFYLSKSLRVPSMIALFSSVFFALHPVHTEVINCGVGRAEILSGIFFLSCLVVHAYFSRQHGMELLRSGTTKTQKSLRRASEILAIFFGFLAMLSKETGITCLGVCAVQDFFLTFEMWQTCEEEETEKGGEKKGDDQNKIVEKRKSYLTAFLNTPSDALRSSSSYNHVLGRLWRRILVMFFSVIVLLMIRLHVMGWTTPGGVSAFSQFDNPLAHTEDQTSRILTGWYLASRHISLLFWPFQPLCHDWSLDSVPLVKTFSDSRNVASAFLLLFLIEKISYAFGLVIFSSHSFVKQLGGTLRTVIPIATASLLVPFIPASNLLFWVGFVIAERVMYLPSIGSCVLVGVLVYIIHRQAKRKVGKLGSILVAMFALCILGFTLRHTILRNNAWRNSEDLYKEDMEVNPLNAKIPYGLGRVYMNRNRFEDAEKAFVRSLHIEPKFGVALAWLGRVYVCFSLSLSLSLSLNRSIER